MTIQLETHETFNAQLCSMFAGMIVTTRDPILRRIAGVNFRRLYKLCSLEERKVLRDCLVMIRSDPKKFMQQQSELYNELSNDEDFIERFREGLNDE